jgi:type IV pilus assembly protein PilC
MATLSDKPITFKYKAIDQEGERVESSMTAGSEDDVLDALRRAGMLPLEVRKSTRFSGDADVMTALRGDQAAKMSTGDLALFTRQLNQMLRAGIPITQSLQALADDPPSATVGEVLRTVADRLVAGAPLSDAFSGYPRVFNEVFVAYMAAGEASGNLDEVTERLAEILDKRAEITRKVKAVSIYPALVGGVIMMMVALILLFIVPKYAEIYSTLDTELPAPTQFIVLLSKWFPIVALAVIIASVAFYSFNKSKADDLVFGERLDRIKFKLPVFGKLFKRLVLYRFASTMGGAISSGVQSYDAVDLAARAAGSRWVRAVAPELRQSIQEGRPMTAAMEAHDDLFSNSMRKMVATGEETGDLATMFTNSADALREDVDLYISTMSAKIEVLMLVFMGATVGGILACLYLPILQLTATVGETQGL